MARLLATSDVFAAIAEPRRRQIIELLARRRGLAVGAIVLTLGLPQPAVSKHLGVLRGAGLVSVSKQGQQRMYELNHDQLRPVYDWVKAFEQHWGRQLDRIRARAERKARAALTPTLPQKQSETRAASNTPGQTRNNSSRTSSKSSKKK